LAAWLFADQDDGLAQGKAQVVPNAKSDGKSLEMEM